MDIRGLDMRRDARPRRWRTAREEWLHRAVRHAPVDEPVLRDDRCRRLHLDVQAVPLDQGHPGVPQLADQIAMLTQVQPSLGVRLHSGQPLLLPPGHGDPGGLLVGEVGQGPAQLRDPYVQCCSGVGRRHLAHRSSTSRSTDTGCPSWTSRSASSARTLRPGIVTGSPRSVSTANGPSTPNRTTPGYESQLTPTVAGWRRGDIDD